MIDIENNFNSHAHVERDGLDKQTDALYKNFNSHAHVERDRPPRVGLFFVYNFNSHAHVERDISTQSSVKVKTISTHTLTWSVTLFRCCAINC